MRTIITVDPSQLAFVVNTRSGGHLGARVMAELGKRVGLDRVADIRQIDVAAWTQRWSQNAGGLIACGGDGTIAALLEAVHGCTATVPVGVMPLGTGNDLGRVAHMPLNASVDSSLAALATAQPMDLDRWILQGPLGQRAWYNYCSWGIDARIAERFHRVRDHHAWFFRSRAANLMAYACSGLQESGEPLAIRVGGAAGMARTPSWLRSLAVLNIPSYAGGRQLGGDIRAADGYCDAFALGPTVALGLALAQCRKPLRLGRHRRLEVTLRRQSFLQLDGEPMVAPVGDYVIYHGGQVRLLTGAVPTRS